MITSSAPCRISLAGGSTDIPAYYEKYGGICVSMAINLRQEIEFDTEQMGFEIPKGAKLEFYKPFFEKYKISSTFAARFNGEITGGIGSSASAAVALLGALHKITGKQIDLKEIAEEAWDIEVNKLKMFGGKQDQYAAAFGGVNVFEFGKEVKVTPIKLHDNIKNSILLFHTGENRKSGKIQEGFKDLSEDQIFYLDKIKELAYGVLDVLPTGNIKEFGRLLNLSWDYKKRSNPGSVSNQDIDDLFFKAKNIGAYERKILGAGSGGYCIFVVEKAWHKQFIENIGIKHIPYEIDYQGIKTSCSSD
jgi:D-glycero-alpha-D-manno-heptose-7-phosphate kinase